jgi:ubiquinone/menaquinone biosynthesis C-methylase UbiE
MGQLVSAQEVQFYDIAVPDWPGEIDFYRAMAIDVKKQAGSILEVGCGTGRVALQLAQEGIRVIGSDLSPSMLEVARRKSQHLPNLSWVEADMQAFELGERFDLILIPGHSFQFMLTPADQLSCLACIRRHLTSGGKLVVHLDHQNLEWLGGLMQGQGTGLELVGEYRQDSTDDSVRKWTAWSYEPSTQTASATTVWEVIGKDGTVKDRKESMKKHLHCVFRFEMEHLLARAGFEVEAIYGNFYREKLQDTSTDMIWVAHAK